MDISSLRPDFTSMSLGTSIRLLPLRGRKLSAQRLRDAEVRLLSPEARGYTVDQAWRVSPDISPESGSEDGFAFMRWWISHTHTFESLSQGMVGWLHPEAVAEDGLLCSHHVDWKAMQSR